MTARPLWISCVSLGLLLPGYAAAQDKKTSTAPARETVAKPLSERERRRREEKLRKELETPYRKWLNEDVSYIITDEERTAFKRLQTDEEREQFIEQFWLRRDPTPDTAENEFKEEHYRRIAYANERYASGIPGWKSDRGRIYITFGPPDEIESHPSGGTYERPIEEGGGTTSTFPFEIWRYRWIEGIGTDILIELFAKLQKPPAIKFKDLEAAVTSKITFNILPMQVRADYFPVTETSILTNVTLQFSNKDLNFQSKDGVQKAVVNIYGRITTMSRRVINVFEDTVTVDSPAEMLAALTQRQSIYQKSIPLAPGMYRLNVVAKDVIGGNMNNYEVALQVPHVDGEKLSSSTLVLADMIEKVPTRSIGTGQFVIGTSKVRPRVNDTFRRDEKLGIYLKLYNFGPDEKTQKPNGVVEYEVIKNGTNEKIFDFSEDVSSLPNASAAQVTIEKLLPLKTLAPGQYTLKLKVTDKNRNQVLTPTAQFTVT
ncbi:MAG: GWxTD domain-containing protein [Bryobacteraceae bacterium]